MEKRVASSGAQISVLLPSRKRPLALAQMLASLYENASDPSRIQVVVAIDPDDTETLAVVSEPPFKRAHYWITSTRYGYNELHRYLNELARLATGEWLMWFNDDMRMLTQGWDDIVLDHRPAILWPHANHVDHANIAPIWPASWSKACGRVSPVQHMDTYLQRLGEALNRHDRVELYLLHDRADVTGNHDDETYAEGRKLLGSEGMVPGFDDQQMLRDVLRDAAIIQNQSQVLL